MSLSHELEEQEQFWEAQLILLSRIADALENISAHLEAVSSKVTSVELALGKPQPQ